MVNTEDVVFLGAARCEKGLYGKGGGWSAEHFLALLGQYEQRRMC